MALTDASVLQNPAQQAAANLFAPATNVLSSALNNAVEAGRRMVDLQSHQEDLFMTEREKLRLASERKGLEARRMFESDRAYNEDVFKDRRNFAQSVLQNDRDFGLKNYIERGQLSLAQSGQELQADLGWAQVDNARVRAETEAAHYSTQDKIANLKIQEAQRELDSGSYFGNQLNNVLSSPTIDRSMDERWARNTLGVGTDVYRSGASMGDMVDLDQYDHDVQQIQDLIKNNTREEVQAAWPRLNDRQRQIAGQIIFNKQTLAGKWNANRVDTADLPFSLTPTKKGAATNNGTFLDAANSYGTNNPTQFNAFSNGRPVVGVNRVDEPMVLPGAQDISRSNNSVPWFLPTPYNGQGEGRSSGKY